VGHGVEKFNVNVDLLKKYDRPGPRYTSYPTAPHFSSSFGPGDYREELARTNEKGPFPPLSLYFHLPFCRSLCYYCGCNVIVTHNPERIQNYIGYVKKEIDIVSSYVHADRRVVQMHWGGGTPTYLSLAQIGELYEHIAARFRLAPDAEISIEIDPRSVGRAHLPMIRSLGFNRVSFGIQDFDERVQAAVNRIQPETTTRWVIEESRRLKFDSINVDLIYGLPYQTTQSYARTLDKIVEISPDRLAVFNYAYVPWMKKHQNLIPEESLPVTSERLNILKAVIERLTGAGYVYIGMDHFAKPGDELTLAMEAHTLHRNFQGYTTHRDADIYAMGVTSISQLKNVYAQNIKDEPEYLQRLDGGELPTHLGCRLDDDDQIRRHVITELMCNNRVVKADVEERFGIEFDSYFQESLKKIKPFVDEGLMSVSDGRLEVMEAGRLVIRNIAMGFDRYLDDNSTGLGQKYSRTV
jgi:oxygen-independent coproporphyrinogen-3 oxidase